MFRKVSLGLAFLVAAVLVAMSVRARVGLGDDSEQSVLVKPEKLAPVTRAPAGSRYGQPAQLPIGSGVADGGGTPAPIRTPAEYGESRYGRATASNESNSDTAPRVSSRTSLVDRIKRMNRDQVERQPAAPANSFAPPAGTDPVVPSRRPGGARRPAETREPAATREPATTNAQGSATAPPVELEYHKPPSSRRPLDQQPAQEPQASSSEGVVLRSPGPSIIIEAAGPKAIQLGKPATYRIAALNTGSLAAQEIHVRVQVPSSAEILKNNPTIGESQVVDNGDGTTRIDWQIDELAARAHEQLELTVTPRDKATMPIKLEWAMRPRQSVAQIAVQEPKLDLAIVGPRAVLYGQKEVFTITVSNPGTGAAQDVVLDVAPGNGASESKRIGTIPAGGREVIKLELTAGDAGEMPIRAAVRAAGGLSKEFRHEVVVRRAKLAIQLEGPGLKYAGAVANYSVRIRNTGDAAADRVEVGLQLPAGAKYLTGLNNVESNNQQLAWRAGTLQPGDERVYKIRCELTLAGENRLNAIAATSDDLRTSAAIATRVEAIADLKLVVNDPQGPQAVGEEVEYEIMILNRGTKSAQAVNVVANFAEGVEPVSAEGLKYELKPGQVIFKAIPRVAPGQTMLLKVRAKAGKGGDHRFRAEVSCAEPNTRLVAEETTRYFGDDPAVTARRP